MRKGQTPRASYAAAVRQLAGAGHPVLVGPQPSGVGGGRWRSGGPDEGAAMIRWALNALLATGGQVVAAVPLGLFGRRGALRRAALSEPWPILSRNCTRGNV